jgi:hypothetical protein
MVWIYGAGFIDLVDKSGPFFEYSMHKDCPQRIAAMNVSVDVALQNSTVLNTHQIDIGDTALQFQLGGV